MQNNTIKNANKTIKKSVLEQNNHGNPPKKHIKTTPKPPQSHYKLTIRNSRNPLEKETFLILQKYNWQNNEAVI